MSSLPESGLVADPPVVLLDGGTGQELLARADGEPTPLWSARVMIDQPELVGRVHAEYLRAGADVITLNAYSATPCRLARYGLEDQFVPLQQRAGELAVHARQQAGRDGARIAGCLSPYGWSYRPDLAPPYEELVPHYAAIAELQAPYVDLFICETMSSTDEARAALDACRSVGKPVWVSFTVNDDDGTHLRSGEPLSAAIEAVLDADAVMVNCSPPEAVEQALTVLAGRLAPVGASFGAYANGFTHIADDYAPGAVTTILGHRHDLTPEVYADRALVWRKRGATIVGGCCDIGPDHIAVLRRKLDGLPIEPE